MTYHGAFRGYFTFAVADRSQHMPGTWAKDQGEYADGVSAPICHEGIDRQCAGTEETLQNTDTFSVVVLDRPLVSG